MVPHLVENSTAKSTTSAFTTTPLQQIKSKPSTTSAPLVSAPEINPPFPLTSLQVEPVRKSLKLTWGLTWGLAPKMGVWKSASVPVYRTIFQIWHDFDQNKKQLFKSCLKIDKNISLSSYFFFLNLLNSLVDISRSFKILLRVPLRTSFPE